MKMKIVANLLVAIHNVATAEAMVLGMKAGLDPEAIVKVIDSGAGTSRVFELRAPLMAAQQLRAADDEMRHLAEGHGDHRRLRDQPRRAAPPLLSATRADL